MGRPKKMGAKNTKSSCAKTVKSACKTNRSKSTSSTSRNTRNRQPSPVDMSDSDGEMVGPSASDANSEDIADAMYQERIPEGENVNKCVL